MVQSVVKEVWPAKSFREKQESVLRACLNAFDNGYDNIVLDAPTGSGKSLLNTALIRYFDDGFYSTPQKSLRTQIQNDPILEPHIEELKSRRDYTCSITSNNCKDCSIYNHEEKSCAEENCSYWLRKQAVMSSDIATITFSMLIVDGMIPPKNSNGTRISFGDRDVIAIDEAHALVQQTRQMHAGFDITPYGFPRGVIEKVTENISWEVSRFEEIEQELRIIENNLKDQYRDIPEWEMAPQEKRCYRLVKNIQRAKKDVENDNPWVVDVESKQYGNTPSKVLQLRPIHVDGFLKNFVWNRANKRIISTATLRHRNNPDIWLNQVGLDPDKTRIISVEMTFPPSNRPVITNEMVCSMKQGGAEKNWGKILNKLNIIAKRYYNSKGICHTVSYSRAEKVKETITEDEHPYLYGNIFLHKGEEEADVAIEEWQESDADLILSPSMMEGIDLSDEMGRYNILMKVPYPAQDSCTTYLCDETKYGWVDYFDRAAIRVAQAYGRTTRSNDDYSDFYILDKDYEKLKKKAKLPDWLLEAEGYEPTGRKSMFDY